MNTWRNFHVSASAESIHSKDLPAERSMWQFSVTEPTLVLGSKQELATANKTACDLDGVNIVRRRSGGGAVFLEPNKHLWVDFVIPYGDELWSRDVGQAMWWVGQIWLEALVACGASERETLVVHNGNLQRSTTSDLICFAGVGSGELLNNGNKIVGISQRRTREFARFQCLIHSTWNSDAYLRYLGLDKQVAADLTKKKIGVAADLSQIADSLLALTALR